eukprot:Colp12_sorted_trinity150504_noHs@13586
MIETASAVLQEILSSPINMFLTFMMVTLLYFYMQPGPRLEEPKHVLKHEPVVQREYTLDELKQHDGSDKNKPLLIAVKGKVYDATRGMSFYGPGGPYSVFSGRDATMGLATMSTDDKVLDNKRDLTAQETETLESWINLFETKYGCVGWVAGSEAAPKTTSSEESKPEESKPKSE